MTSITLGSANVLRFADNTGALPPDGEGIDYFFGFGFGFDEEPKVVAVRAHVLAFTKETLAEFGDQAEGDVEKSKMPPRDLLAAELEVECAFALGDLDPFRNTEGEVKLPRPLIAHLMGITVSTARGIFIGAGCSSLLQKAPIPILQPIAIVDDMVTQDHWWIADPADAPAEREE